MLRNWPLLFIIIPLVELYLLIKVGGYIGAIWTVLIVVMTAIIGINLLRYQGFATLRKAQLNMAQGSLPAMEMMEGIFLAVGGALLITPGFITDTFGFLCLIPMSRQWLIRQLINRSTIQMHGYTDYRGDDPFSDDHRNTRDSQHQGRTLEGEYTRKDE